MNSKFLAPAFYFPEDDPVVRFLRVDMEKGMRPGRSISPTGIEKKPAHDPSLFVPAETGGIVLGMVSQGFS